MKFYGLSLLEISKLDFYQFYTLLDEMPTVRDILMGTSSDSKESSPQMGIGDPMQALADEGLMGPM